MRHALRTQQTSVLRLGAVLGTLGFLLLSGPALAQSAKLTVQVDRPGAKISPTLYGIFFEEINLAGDGGLYAELVRNRSFEDTDKPDHWSLVTGGSMKGQMAIDTQRPMSAKNRRSLRLTITPGGEGRLGVANAGYFGIALEKDAEYELSLAARAGEGFSGPLTATLEDLSGRQVYAQARIDNLTGQWKTFHVALVAGAADPKARLVIAASQPGVLWLDMVSLFPKQTWKGRTNGLRPDLAEMLAGLRPSFMRFPGGCWVEGDFLRFSQRWKTTIGELSERRTLWNLWKYYSTNGLGFHEYLQLCEDLGAEPLFVINCGMSHQETVPINQMAEWVQDALDAIEYANGPVESRFGAMRAKAGHPAPFHLKYMEIGNENGGPAYQERFPLFYDAIKARYPKMTLIADERTGRRRPDVVDEHYYSSPGFFIGNAHKYDTYDRHGPRIYVGEYAVTAECGQGNLQGAIGEAAFMTGMERNSDVVVMASYAPLFANVNYKKWNPDLIDFDGSRVYGLPSYYVQKMFSENRGDVVLPATVKAASPGTGKPAGGAIGLGTWSTQAEFKDVRVTADGKTLFAANFTEGSKGWKPFRGQWSTRQGALHQAATETDCRISAGDPGWHNYTLRLKARKLGGAEGFLIMCRARDEKNWIWWNLGGWGNQQHGLEQCLDGTKSMLGAQVPGQIETGRWYDLRIELLGERIRCYLDGQLVHDVSLAKEPLYAVASRVDATGEIILKVVNVSRVDQDTQIELCGAQEVGTTAKAIVLNSANPTDENSLAEPTKVAPVSRTIDGAAANFRHTFAANSVTILRLTAR